ncbi:hypothetical protein [Shewanella pealeana]|uniref:Uncharacterized protein n=1 Tax=Shewanella pealeana (strain ATCC 700345 / ANG-SQ1) TaxID=398579 RepID=A8H8V7_SHEPA|nr:hypothetical protein [Shewanella pealeana]ABV88994.1 hypothetical protein Spea_3683 [Shewanella pealeana ATCC 700345]
MSKYPPSYQGLHAWHDKAIAKGRTTYGDNDFLYEFDYPIESIDGLVSVNHVDIFFKESEPINEIAVKLKEDTGSGVNQYHVVVLDYSLISNWRKLDAIL